MSLFRHVGLVVDDIEIEINFYKKFFNFKVVRDMYEEGEFFENLLGVKNIKARTVKMSDDTDNIVLELLKFFDGDIEYDDKRRNVRDKGYTHFAITVKNIDKIYQELQLSNISFVNAPQLSPDGGAKVAFLLDPENNLVEIVQPL